MNAGFVVPLPFVKFILSHVTGSLFLLTSGLWCIVFDQHCIAVHSKCIIILLNFLNIIYCLLIYRLRSWPRFNIKLNERLRYNLDKIIIRISRIDNDEVFRH